MSARLAALALVALALPARAETPSGAPEEWPAALHGAGVQSLVLVDQLEFRLNDGDDALAWEAEAWLGGDAHKLWLESEGDWNASGAPRAEAELQALYAYTWTAFWTARIGVRQDFLFGAGPDRERTFAALSLEGLAPYGFELTPEVFVSEDGDFSARLEATLDLLLTQRLVAQPRLELNAAASDAREFGVARGLNDLELGLRLRYELRREIAPYVGVSWLRKLGPTANLARDDGEGASAVGFVAGLRFWF